MKIKMSLEHLVLLERNCFKDERTKGKERGQKIETKTKEKLDRWTIKRGGMGQAL